MDDRGRELIGLLERARKQQAQHRRWFTVLLQRLLRLERSATNKIQSCLSVEAALAEKIEHERHEAARRTAFEKKKKPEAETKPGEEGGEAIA